MGATNFWGYLRIASSVVGKIIQKIFLPNGGEIHGDLPWDRIRKESTLNKSKVLKDIFFTQLSPSGVRLLTNVTIHRLVKRRLDMQPRNISPRLSGT